MNNEVEIKSLIDKFYEIISGRLEEERNWESFKSLFFTNAHLMSVRFNGKKECISLPLDIEAYILALDKFLKTQNFYEYGLNYEINVYSNIAHVYSEYKAKTCLDDNTPIKKGVNLVQLVNGEDGWKIVSMLWQDE